MISDTILSYIERQPNGSAASKHFVPAMGIRGNDGEMLDTRPKYNDQPGDLKAIGRYRWAVPASRKTKNLISGRYTCTRRLRIVIPGVQPPSAKDPLRYLYSATGRSVRPCMRPRLVELGPIPRAMARARSEIGNSPPCVHTTTWVFSHGPNTTM